jgi:hypothetical protein
MASNIGHMQMLHRDDFHLTVRQYYDEAKAAIHAGDA